MPARAGMARLLGHFLLDLLVYGVLAIAIVVAGVAVMFPSGALKPSYTGPHTIMLTLAPCATSEGREQHLLDALAEHGEVRPATTRRGQALPLELLPGYLPDDTPMQMFSALIVPPPGRTVAIDPDAFARQVGCPVRDLLQSPEPPFTAERMLFPPAFVTLALVATALAGGLAWLFRRPGRGLALARGTVPAALVLALSVALLAQLLPRLLAWVGLPLAPSNAADITRLLGEWPLVATALVVLVAPLAEEAFFRGVLLRRFVVAGRPWAGLWLSAGVFALAHELFADGPWTQTLVTSATYLAMGMLFGAVYVRTGRLSAAFLAHAASNALALATVAFSSP